MITGHFPDEMMTGKICLQLEIDDDKQFEKENNKYVMFAVAFGFIGLVIVKYYNFRVTRFLSGFCPQGRLSCIGVYKRNVISLSDTSNLLIIWYTANFVQVAFLYFIANQEKSHSKKFVFFVWNIKGFIFNEGFNFVLPLSLEIPSEIKPFDATNKFYVRKASVLEPRLRPVLKLNDQSNIQVQTRKDIKMKLLLSIPTPEEDTQHSKSYRCTTYCEPHKHVARCIQHK